MALRDFNNLSYLPILAVRPAEMRALQELPERSKDQLLPMFLLRAWGASHQLQSSINRLADCYGERSSILDLADREPPGATRPVHEQLAQLRDPQDGFANWCAFIERNANFIPTLRIGDVLDQVDLQAGRLIALNRGLVLRFPRGGFAGVEYYAQRIALLTNGGENVIFILDYERADASLLLYQAESVAVIRRILANAPAARVATSASSFPDSFGNTLNQEIYERRLFNGVRAALGAAQLVYSDRGSARAERQLAGGGIIYPRIDYALAERWQFFRAADGPVRIAIYRALANQIVRSADWDPNLRLWGTQMIERTSLGDPEAITSPARATAARINVHLHRQLFYDEPGSLHETDEDWTD